MGWVVDASRVTRLGVYGYPAECVWLLGAGLCLLQDKAVARLTTQIIITRSKHKPETIHKSHLNF